MSAIKKCMIIVSILLIYSGLYSLDWNQFRHGGDRTGAITGNLGNLHLKWQSDIIDAGGYNAGNTVIPGEA